MASPFNIYFLKLSPPASPHTGNKWQLLTTKIWYLCIRYQLFTLLVCIPIVANNCLLIASIYPLVNNYLTAIYSRFPSTHLVDTGVYFSSYY